jgi:glycosyltransferase involved in cell wall biosynthesis
MHPFVSVIVPVYNVETFFERCLQSLFGQTLNNIEYIFINDCTPDNSMSLLKRLLEEYPHRKEQVRIITHGHNLGLAAARKAGMKAATGEYVISCDSDDWVETDMYEKMYAKAIEEDANIVCCDWVCEYGRKTEAYMEGQDSARNTRWDTLSGPVWNKLVKRTLYVDNNVYPYEGVNMWEDVGVSMRLCYLSEKTVCIHKSFYHYNQQNSNAYTSRKRKQSFVKEQIKCAQELEVFFREQGAFEKYNLSIQSIKFFTKLPLLYDGLYQEWLHTFPETHRCVGKLLMFSLFRKPFCQRRKMVPARALQHSSLSRKIIYFLAAHGIFFPYKLRREVLHLYEIVQRRCPLIGGCKVDFG